MATLKAFEQARPLDATDMSRSLAEFCVAHYGDTEAAIVALDRVRFTRSEDLGTALFAMAEQGIVLLSDEDRREQFDGLFTLSSLFDGWGAHAGAPGET